MSLKIYDSRASCCILAVAAGKGGVGKSTVTVNLALALQLKGYRVGVLDADLYGPSIRRMLPEEKPPRQEGTALMPAESYGIKTISMAYFRPENQSSAVRAPIANKLINQFLNQVQWGDLDFLLIDYPPGTGDIQLTLSQQVTLSGALMVTTPQEVANADVRKAIHLFEQVRVPVIGIVENLSGYHDPRTGEHLHLFGEGGGRRLADEMGIPLLSEISIDPLVSSCGDLGRSLFEEDTKTPSLAAKSFRELSRVIEDWAKASSNTSEIGLQSFDQIDRQSFSISWSDGLVQKYTLENLQAHCPCAACTENRAHSPETGLSARSISPVGRYAIRIEFTSGCSHGIYSFDTLRKIGERC